MYQGRNSRGVFSKLSNFPLSTMWKWTSTDLEVLVHFHIVERGKLESLESLENIPNFPNFFRGLKRPLHKLLLNTNENPKDTASFKSTYLLGVQLAVNLATIYYLV